MCLGKGTESKSCTGVILLKEHNMKKTIIATLAILIIASVSIFAAPVTDNFTVTTTVAEIGNMKIVTTAAVPTDNAFTGLTDFTNLPITSSGSQGTVAYMATISNKRTGYKVTMAATPMTSTVGSATSYIDYTVACGTQSIVTKGALAPEVTGTAVDTVTSLTAITGKSIPITLSVDDPTFAAAVSGSYVGTVTFTFTAT